MNTPIDIFVSSNTTGTGEDFIRASVASGARAVLLSKQPERHAFAMAAGAEIRRVDVNDGCAVLGECQRVSHEGPLRAVLTSSEYSLQIAATVARALGLPGPDPEGIAIARDKKRQRQAFDAAGLRSPRWLQVDSIADLVSALTALGGRAVIKPTDGSGSVGVRLVGSAADAIKAAQAVRAGSSAERRAVLVEEYVSGPQYSVELFHGVPVGVTRNHIGAPPSFIETGHDFPATCNAEATEALSDLARRAVAALGVAWGPSHVELRMTDNGPVLIEVNARLAGGQIPTLVRLATGIDLVGAAVTAAGGGDVCLVQSRSGGAALRFIVASQAGFLRRVDGIDGYPANHRVTHVRLTAALDSYIELNGDFRDRIGYVIAEADRTENAAEAAERAVKGICVNIAKPKKEENQ